jgi:hypothetical protein
MRIRSTAAAALVAAGLSVALTGAAAAGEPDPDGAVIITCENGEPVRRALTDEEREWIPTEPAPPGAVHVRPAEPAAPVVRGERVERDFWIGRDGDVVPAPEPPSMCAVRAEPAR